MWTHLAVHQLLVAGKSLHPMRTHWPVPTCSLSRHSVEPEVDAQEPIGAHTWAQRTSTGCISVPATQKSPASSGLISASVESDPSNVLRAICATTDGESRAAY